MSGAVLDRLAALVPGLAGIDDGDHGQHNRHLNQDPDDCGQSGPRLKAIEADGSGDRQFKKIASPDQGRGPGHGVCLANHPVQAIGKG